MTCGNDPSERDDNSCRNEKCNKVLDDYTSSRLSVRHGLCQKCYEIVVSGNPKKYLSEIIAEIRSEIEKTYAYINDTRTNEYATVDAVNKCNVIVLCNINFIERYLENNVY